MSMNAADTRRRVIKQIVGRAGIEVAAFDSIADASIYEILDSLDVVQLLAAVETEFGKRLNPNSFPWESQPTIAQLAELLTALVLR